jgi:pyruvate kinase
METISRNNDNCFPGKEPDFYLAGQVFHHLTCSRQPTRSEVSHYYNVSMEAYSGIVLSDETAIGVDPINAVRIIRNMRNLCTSIW